MPAISTMPVAVFENNRDEALTFTIEPGEQEHILPPLAKIGVRYTFAEGAPDRTFASYSEGWISFWCDATDIEIEIVHPTAFDRLLWHLCVTQGFCGGVVNGESAHVTDHLPTNGTVTAEEFAILAPAAEGDDEEDPAKRERWITRLKALFCEHMGSASVPAESLTRNYANPFDGSAHA